jgi:hypothetical protein
MRRERCRPALRLLKVCSARHNAILWQNQHDQSMKHIFSSLLLIGLATLAGETRAQSQETSAPSGQVLVAAAAKNVENESAISADMRYRVDAFGHQLVGAGSYLQQGTGAEKLVRLELKMQVAGQAATLQEIRGTDYYWVRREVPPAVTTLGRVDLREMRRSLELSSDARPGDVLPTSGWIMLGGLGRLMTALESSFEFGLPKADELKFTAADGQSIERLPIWVVEGHWKPDRLAHLNSASAAKKTAPKLPDQLPDQVEIILGRTKDVLPLFPYRITYTRTGEPTGTAGQGRGGEPPVRKELLVLEFFNVFRKTDIEAGLFEYNPGDQVVQDLTTAYVQRYSSSETKLR